MSEEIVNRVANSNLITLDLETLYPEGERIRLDISQWLEEGIILREKAYRDSLNDHNWQQYKGKYVALHCSTDAIIPGWAYMLVGTLLAPVAKGTVVGDLEALENSIFTGIIESLDLTGYKDKPVVIAGCSNKPVPQNAYVMISQKLQGVAKSIMFGEACSSVPLYKRKSQTT